MIALRLVPAALSLLTALFVPMCRPRTIVRCADGSMAPGNDAGACVTTPVGSVAIIEDVRGNSVRAPGFVNDGLIVTGAELAGVTAASLLGPGGLDAPVPLSVQYTGDALLLGFPAGFGVSRPTKLTLALDAPAGRASVILTLQPGVIGRAGPTGATGPAGRDGSSAPRLAHTCASDSFVSGIDARGVVSCRAYAGEAAPADRFYAVSAYDFRPSPGGGSNGARWPSSAGAISRSNASQASELLAPVRLPDGAVLSGFGCLVEDNDISADLTLRLRRASGGVSAECATPMVSSGQTPSAMWLGTAAIAPGCVAGADNAVDNGADLSSGGPLSGYTLSIDAGASLGGISVFACHVRYQVVTGLP